MQRYVTTVAAVAVLLTVVMASANVNIETVPVGNPGNSADTRYVTPGYGRVDYTYNIGTYEVTAGQYTAFLNAVAGVDAYGLYRTDMWSSDSGCKIERYAGNGTADNPYQYRVANDVTGGFWANRPVNYVSYWDSCRFANWLHNGQPSGAQGPGTTERGAYTLDGYNGQDGRTIQRNPGCRWAVTSEDEWYKAAYHKNDGASGNYFDYPTGSDSVPGRDLNDVSGNNANYYGTPLPIQSPYYTTVAGEFQNSDSPYGTFDQGGNAWEWNESVVYEGGNYASRCVRGGAFLIFTNDLHAANRGGRSPASGGEGSFVGFRVTEVPEPAAIVLLAFASLGVVRRRR